MDIKLENIIRANKMFGEKIYPHSTLDSAVDRARYEKSRFKKLALIVRSIVVEHAFTDANKRTALTVIMSELKQDYKINRKKLVITLRNIAKQNTGNLDLISKRIRKCCKMKNLKK